MVFRNHLITLIFAILSTTECIIHEFSLGRIKGISQTSRNGRKFYAFLGLPFAKPPLDELRFQNPDTELESWSHLYDATKEAPPCVQGGAAGAELKGDEDCLYLNLYIPKLPNNTLTKMAVWFFIFPGRHLFGDADLSHYGPHYIMDHDVIFISSSYRLGPFGFLSTEDNVIPGNFGLKDQTAVLMWIQKYISEFGGDPNRVTISGESSSAVDVGMHTISPLSKNLFHRAILQSGHYLNYRAISQLGTSRKQAWRLGKILGCTGSYIRTSEDLLDCIKTYSSAEISGSMLYMMHDFILPHTFFGIVIEDIGSNGAFFTNHPINEITKANNISLLLGINTEEGQQKALGIFAFPTKNKKLKQKVLNHFKTNAERLIPYLFGFDYLPKAKQILEKIKKQYFGDKSFEDSFQGFSKAFGLASIQIGMFELALKYKGTKYFYHYDHLNNPSYQKMYIVRFKFDTREKLGVIHGEELRSLMYQPVLFPPTLEGNDRIVSNQVVELWSNFVVHGDPNGKNMTKIWHPVTTSCLEYLYIKNGKLVMKTKPFWRDYQFWKKLEMPQMMTQDRMENSGFK